MSATKSSLWFPLHVSVALGLFLASLDIAINLVGSGPLSVHPMLAGLLPVAVVGHLLCWFVLAATRRFEPAALAVAIAGFILPPASVLTLAGFVDFDAALAAAATRAGWLQLGVLCFTGLANGFLIYRFLISHTLPASTLRLASQISLAAPVAAFALAIGIWIQEQSGPAPDISKIAVLPPALVVLALGTHIWRVGSTRALLTAVHLSSIAAFALPVWLANANEPIAPARASSAVSSDGPPLVLFISVDTLRRDALSIYDPSAPPTPAFESLAADALVFDRAYASAPWTLPSLASLHTGLPEIVHEMHGRAPGLPKGLRTLAQQFTEAGYATAAIGSNPWLELGLLGRGFEYTEFYPRTRSMSAGAQLLGNALKLPETIDRDTAQLTDTALGWLHSRRDEARFLWLHYFDPHSPYEPPAEFLTDSEVGLRAFDQPYRVMSGSWQTRREDKARIRELYAAEVRYVDHSLGRLLDRLRQEGVYDDALIVLTADHGEEFWDHDTGFHGHTFFDEMLRVPLMIKYPNSERVGRIQAPVSNASLGGTLMEACGLASDGWHAFFPQLPLEEPAHIAPVFSYGSEYFERRHAVVFDEHKLVVHLDSDRRELYDLTKDPGERRDHAELEPDRVDHMLELLDEQRANAEAAREALRMAASGETAMSDEIRAQLEALGYVQ